MFEMGFSLFVILFFQKTNDADVFLSIERLKKIIPINKSLKPVLLFPPLLSFETMAVSPLFRPSNCRHLGAIYRPNKNKTLDEWITGARQEVGIKTFSRKRGLIEARSHLKAGNWLGLLYDQNAGVRGLAVFSFGRICSFSPLPDLLAKNKKCHLRSCNCKKTVFF